MAQVLRALIMITCFRSACPVTPSWFRCWWQGPCCAAGTYRACGIMIALSGTGTAVKEKRKFVW